MGRASIAAVHSGIDTSTSRFEQARREIDTSTSRFEQARRERLHARRGMARKARADRAKVRVARR